MQKADLRVDSPRVYPLLHDHAVHHEQHSGTQRNLRLVNSMVRMFGLRWVRSGGWYVLRSLNCYYSMLTPPAFAALWTSTIWGRSFALFLVVFIIGMAPLLFDAVRDRHLGTAELF